MFAKIILKELILDWMDLFTGILVIEVYLANDSENTRTRLCTRVPHQNYKLFYFVAHNKMRRKCKLIQLYIFQISITLHALHFLQTK